MTLKLTKTQADLLYIVLSLQIGVETEHLENSVDSISKHNTRNIIKRMQTIKAKLEQNND